MTEDEFNSMANEYAEKFVALYGNLCQKGPNSLVILAMIGSLAACASEGGFIRDGVVSALNSAFDDIERGEGENG